MCLLLYLDTCCSSASIFDVSITFLNQAIFFFLIYALPLITTLGSSSSVSEQSRRPPVVSGSPFVLA